MTPKELAELSPEDFLFPEKFVTEWPIEKDPTFILNKELEGRNLSREAFRDGGAIHISADCVWSHSAGSYSVQSFERIGYHAGTWALLKGFLSGPAAIYVHRKGMKEPVLIKEAMKL